MITVDKVTEFFCIIDEYSKNLNEEMRKYPSLPSSVPPRTILIPYIVLAKTLLSDTIILMSLFAPVPNKKCQNFFPKWARMAALFASKPPLGRK